MLTVSFPRSRFQISKTKSAALVVLIPPAVEPGDPPINMRTISKRIVAIFRPFDPDKIIVFGSSVRGSQDPFSDVDVIVVYSTDKSFMSRLRDLYESWDIPKAVDILAYAPEEFQKMLKDNYFVKQAVNSGDIIYERAREGD